VALDGAGAPDGWGRWLLVRRNRKTKELAYYACAGLPLVALVRVAGARWRVEVVFPQLAIGWVRAVG